MTEMRRFLPVKSRSCTGTPPPHSFTASDRQWWYTKLMGYWEKVYLPHWIINMKLSAADNSLRCGVYRYRKAMTKHHSFKQMVGGCTGAASDRIDPPTAPPTKSEKIDGKSNVMNSILNTKITIISERGMKFSKPISLSKEKYRYGTCYQMRIRAWTIMIDVLQPANILVSHSTGARDNDKPTPKPD